MSDEKTYATAPCSICGRVMRVKKDGTIGHHGGELGKGWMFNRAYSCDGVGNYPTYMTCPADCGGTWPSGRPYHVKGCPNR